MSDAASPLLEVRGLVKEYPGVRALGGVDLRVTSGQVHCLIGQNGAGEVDVIKLVPGYWLSRLPARSGSKASRSRSGIRTRRSPAASPPSTRSLTWSRTCRSRRTCF